MLLLASGLFVPYVHGTGGAVIVGWGGAQLNETGKFSLDSPASEVFAGEQASNQEMQVRRLAEMGLNAVRVSFESQCTTWREAGPYNATHLERSFSIAERFRFWIIVDYHGFNDTSSEATVDCWVSFWAGVISQFKDRYYKTVWEPLNEPTGVGFSHAAVVSLGTLYQRWIDQARGLGDSNWIVVQNLCSFRCDFSDKSDGYPTVSDPLGKILISIHPYMSYRRYWATWDNATAESRAFMFYNAIKNGTMRTGWTTLNTEGGAGGTFNGTERCPDLVLTGSAGYCGTNFHFIQTLTRLLDNHLPLRINWVWWTMSSGTNTAGAGLYGALNTWGGILEYMTVLAGDLNHDCVVDISDVATMAFSFGSSSLMANWNPKADLNNDGTVNIFDFALVASNFGETCP